MCHLVSLILHLIFLQNLKFPKSSSLSFYTSNYSDWKSYYNNSPNNDKLGAKSDQITEIDNSSQIPDIQLSVHHSIVNEQLENSNYVIFNSASKMQSTNNSTTETTNLCSQNNAMLPKQTILLKQQLTQHTQLLTQSYLLCSMTQKFKNYCQKLKTMVVSV